MLLDIIRDIPHDIFVAFWFFAPAGVANVVPILAARLPGLRAWTTPLDFGHSWRGARVLGDHKTWRGLVTGIVAATIIVWLQQFLVGQSDWLERQLAQIDYANLPTLLAGLLFGLGALGGDAIESFFKRRQRIAAGHSWFPFDQLDYIIGGALALLPLVRLELVQYLWLAILWLLIHLVASYIGYKAHLKDRPI